ncbi:hypothetical protein FAZ19_19635 [Sphingobacterium alkalisoli]|uniref:Uncharacterized protein n=1 Tax=Sphingobacterium alkalisoli TaxID=1874115 RepID=A0A4U0GUJ4_9SPHI|nr:hypothetical protein [Sphingobacterium alkalisoli]TJY62683.1 hypothetical protein FAZ19_19635 [Sphingobacterium alkalisoli]GGH28195.1 hypothetical protein GCM10011418_38670 [Sphingobacterium alkalisoli]
MLYGFAIKYKDVLLDVESGSNLTMEWYSTVFNESELFRGSYSYPVDLKWSEKNLTALNFANVLANRLARISVEVSILLFDHTWKSAIMEVEVEDQRLPATLLIDNSIISDTIKDNTLPDMFSYYDGTSKKYSTISMGTTEAEIRAHMLATATNPSAYSYAFPSMTNFGLFGERDLSGNAWINSFNWEDPTVTGAYQLSNIGFYCPTFYLVWLIEEICSKMGFDAIGSFLSHPEIRTWVIYNTGYYTGAEIKADGFALVPARHFPKITVSNFFKILRNDFKLFIYFDSLTKKAHFDISDRILEKESSLDFTEWILDRSMKIKPVKDKAFRIVTAVDDGDEAYKYLSYTKSKRVGLGSDLKAVELAVGAPFMNSGIFTGTLPSPLRQIQTAQTANIYDEQYGETTGFNKKGEISVNEFGFRVFSFRGLLPNSLSEPTWRIPYGTSDNRNALGVVQAAWISTSINGDNNWLDLLCGQFYKLLTLTETVEFNARVPADRFMEVTPMNLCSVSEASKVKTAFLPDRITFEPGKNNVQIYTRVKGYAFHKVFGLLDPGLFELKSYEVVEPTEMAYVAWRWVDNRIVPGSGSEWQEFAKVEFSFYSDPYMMTPKAVSALEILYFYRREFGTGGVIDDPMSVTTGSNVKTHVTGELAIFTNVSGGNMRATIILLESPDKRYVPVF